MLISFLSGAAWDMAGKVDAALIPIVLGTLPISILAPTQEGSDGFRHRIANPGFEDSTGSY
jgi:hypothetical protein